MSEQRLFCYCFEVPLDQARADPEVAVAKIRERVATEGCWCSERNPAGRCCLSERHRLGAPQEVSFVGAVSAGLGAGVLSLGASACCVPVLAPLLVSVLGVTGSIWAASLTPYSVWIVLTSGLVIGWAAWSIYRPRATAAAVCRSRPAPVVHIGFWLAVSVWILALGLNIYYKWWS